MRRQSIKSQTQGLLLGLMLCCTCNTVAAEVVVIVSPRSPVAAISKNQVVNIFLGQNTRFPDGSSAIPIDQVESSAQRHEFYTLYANKAPAQVKAHWSRIIFTGRGQPPKTVENDAEVKKRIAENPNAIGYIDHTQVDDSVKVLVMK
jgi:ABC-type phosphate transport system substrate-binding protein